MIKRVLVLVIVVLAFTAASAAAAAPQDADGLWIGPTGFFDMEVALDEALDFTEGDMSLGLDARLRLGLFEGSLLAMGNPFAGEDEKKTMVLLNGGVNINLQSINLGASLGANYIYEDEGEDPEQIGANAKISADFMMGNFAVGAYYVSMMDSFADFDISEFADAGFIGVTALFRMF